MDYTKYSDGYFKEQENKAKERKSGAWVDAQAPGIIGMGRIRENVTALRNSTDATKPKAQDYKAYLPAPAYSQAGSLALFQ